MELILNKALSEASQLVERSDEYLLHSVLLISVELLIQAFKLLVIHSFPKTFSIFSTYQSVWGQNYSFKVLLLYIKIILLGIISKVCIARTSGKTESGSHTAMRSCSLVSWAWSGLKVSPSRESASAIEECPGVSKETSEGDEASWAAVIQNISIRTNFKRISKLQLHYCTNSC